MIQKTFAMAASLVLTACAYAGTATVPLAQESNAMTQASQQPPIPPVVTSGELAPLGDPVIAARMNFKPVEWPLRFKSFSLSAGCYDTLECHIPFEGLNLGRPKPSRSSASYGPDYLKGLAAGKYGGIRNFPPPIKVSWRSKDGSSHQAEIDLGELFKDQLIRHQVPREEVADQPDGKYDNNPSILLEVNDRTIRVYMAAFIPTKHFQTSGNKYSAFRDDPILVKTYIY
jgi:hypothetical protein